MRSADTNVIKRAYTKQAYTEHEILELHRCMDPVTGPQYFMENYVYVQHVTHGKVLFKLYDYQKDLIDAYHNYRYSVSLVSRQMGKSALASAYLLWYATFIDDVTILIASNKNDGAMEIMHRLRYAYENLPNFLRAGAATYNKKSIEFDNGSRIIAQATTENTGRGLTLNLVYLDEFAFVPPRIAKEFWTSISPTLSTGGKCIITSTPNSDEDQFAEIWNLANRRIDEYGNEKATGVNGFRPYLASWERHPERDEKWALEEYNKIGPERFAREHECKFIIFEETLINSTKLANMEGIEPIRRDGQVRWYKKVSSDKSYVVGLDPAMGTGGDYAAIQVFELPTMEQVAEWQHNKSIVEAQIKTLQDILKYLESEGAQEIFWSVENNSLGEAALAVIRSIGEDYFPGTLLNDPVRTNAGRNYRKGFTTTAKSKIEACSRLKSWLESGKMKVNSRNLISELKTFIAKSNSYEAKQGTTDDLVMSTILIVRMIGVVADWEDSVAQAISTTKREDGDHSYDEDEEDYNTPLPIL